jgi:peptidoglycan/LPS O-acetylase OafA/YrhL
MSAESALGGDLGPSASVSARIDWLDGVRACAASYVVLHHIYLGLFPGFPVTSGPASLGWLMYGHLSVVVFIVVSGFSLGLGPAKNANVLKGGARTFFERRAWRILPPYWAALAFSIAVVHFLLPEAPGHEVNVRTALVFGSLLHDVVPANTPNSAFWSIAVEAQIYLVFPVMLMLARARSAVFSAAAVLAVVCALHLIAQTVPGLYRLDHLSMQLYAGFAFGDWAADEAFNRRRFRNWPMTRIALAIVIALIGLELVIGFPRFQDNYFWIDIVVAFAVALAFVGFAEGKSMLPKLFSSRALDFVGRFSYSLYLVHVPIVAALLLVFNPPIDNPVVKYAVVACVIAPLILAFAYFFFLLFERPFLTVRSWGALRLSRRRSARPRFREQGGLILTVADRFQR